MNPQFFCKAINLTLVIVLLALTFGAAGAAPAQARPAGTMQRVAPGQTPDGLTAVEWQAVQAAVAAAEYHLAYHNADKTHASPYYWAPNRPRGGRPSLPRRARR